MNYREALNLMWAIDSQIDDLRDWVDESDEDIAQDTGVTDRLSTLAIASDSVINYLRRTTQSLED